MADQKINIAIGTSYNGNGMNSALGSVDKLSKTAGKAAGAVGSLGNALGGISGKAGQAVGSISKLTGALSMGGPVGLAVAGVTTLIGAFNEYQEKQEAAKKATEEHAKKLKKLQEEAAKKAWKDFVDDLAKGRTEADGMATALQKVVALENALATAKQNNATATQNLAQAELAASTAAKVRAESTPEGKALAQAKGNVAMAQMQGQAGIANAEARASAVKSNISALEQTYDAMVGMHDALEQKIQELENAWVNGHGDDIETAILDARGDGKYDGLSAADQASMDAKIREQLMKKDTALQKKITAIREEEAKVQERIRDEGLKLAALREQEEAAEKGILQAKVQAAENEAATKEAQLEAENNLAGARLAAEEKIVKLKQQQEIEEANELGRLEWQARLEEKETQHKEEIEKLDEQIKQAKENLKNAIQRADRAYKAANPNLETMYYGAAGDNAEAFQRRMSSSSNWGTGRQYNAQKAERWAATHGRQLGGLSQAEKREYEELAGRFAGGNELSKSQRNRLRELAERDPERKAQKAQEEAEKAEKELVRLEKEKKQKQEKFYQDVSSIKDTISQLKTN